MLREHGKAETPSTATEDHDTFIRSLRAQAEAAMSRIEQVCPWCGVRCNTRAEHEHLARQSETTWRRAAV